MPTTAGAVGIAALFRKRVPEDFAAVRRVLKRAWAGA